MRIAWIVLCRGIMRDDWQYEEGEVGRRMATRWPVLMV